MVLLFLGAVLVEDRVQDGFGYLVSCLCEKWQVSSDHEMK